MEVDIKEVLAIIPARGGSKRIPQKNIKNFLGKPIISYPIQVALESNCFDEVMVSTESEKIACIAKESGAQVPFMRSQEGATDSANVALVIEEVLNEYAKRGRSFKYLCCLYATACLATVEQLRKGLNLVQQDENASAITVFRLPYHVQYSWVMHDKGLGWMFPEYRHMKTQGLPDAYYDAGGIYWLDVEQFCAQKGRKEIMIEPSMPVLVKESEAQDIDTLDDWMLAEKKYTASYKTDNNTKEIYG